MSNSNPEDKFPPKTPKEELFDAILGPDEEISQDIAEEIVHSYGSTREQLVENLKTQLQERIKEVRDETGVIPNALVAMLNNVREYQKEKVPKAVRADEWIGEIFSGAMPNAHAQPVYNFRKCSTGQVSEKDSDILDQMKADLEE